MEKLQRSAANGENFGDECLDSCDDDFQRVLFVMLYWGFAKASLVTSVLSEKGLCSFGCRDSIRYEDVDSRY